MSFTASIMKRLKQHRTLFRILKGGQYFLKGVSETNPLVYNCRQWTSSKLLRALLKAIVSPYYVWDYFRHKDIPGREGLVFVLIAKDETDYIEEWLDFHRKQGVSHFIIFDNESASNFHEVLMPYIDAGLVTYRTIKGKVRQRDAYNAAVHDYRDRFKYMCFIDVDEFMFVRDNTHWGGSQYL